MTKTGLKNLRYELGDILLNILLTLSLLIFRVMSQKAMVLIARVVGIIFFYLIKKYRDRVLSNLSLAFGGEKDPKEIQIIAKEVFFHFTLTPLESIYLLTHMLPFERFIMKIRIKGKEHLDAALSQGKGVIALGAHLGSFTLLGTRLAVEGCPVNIIVNQGNFPKLWKRLNAYQGIEEHKLFPPKPALLSIKKSMNCLHKNEVLYLVADEQQRRGGLPVSFFGQTAYTPTGPAIFSLKTGAPILPMFVIRENLRENGLRRTLVIDPPIEIERTFDEKKDIQILTGKFTKTIEETVRQYPHQWAWLNRRWKLPRPKVGLDIGEQSV